MLHHTCICTGLYTQIVCLNKKKTKGNTILIITILVQPFIKQ